MDDSRQEVFTIWETEPLYFGQCNSEYLDDARRLIDLKLDIISLISNGGKLIWFQNGAFRDIKLCYSNRVVKIWLVDNVADINLDRIKSEANKIISKLHTLKNKK